jgi:hypothetical protein
MSDLVSDVVKPFSVMSHETLFVLEYLLGEPYDLNRDSRLVTPHALTQVVQYVRTYGLVVFFGAGLVSAGVDNLLVRQ